MKNLLPNESLVEAIALLEAKRDRELIELKEQFHAVNESLKPINLIKDAFRSVTASPDLKNGIDKTLIGGFSGFLVKNILFRNSFNPLKIITRIGLQAITASFAAQNSDKIKSTSQKLFHAILSKIKLLKNEVHES